MHARQRGAAILLALLLVGRGLDALDLPWERHVDGARQPVHSSAASAGTPEADSGRSLPAAAAPKTAESAPTPPAPVKINEATASQLQALPGIGPVLAARIVAFRQEHGPFADLAALRQVKGVGARMTERLAPLLRFE